MNRRDALSLLAIGLVACGGTTTAPDLGTTDGGMDAGSPDAGARDAGADVGGCSTDFDGDGHRSIACGGDDCNDGDPSSYPGNAEYCDGRGHDEDCDPATLGPDRDGDGFVSSRCCDQQPDGSLLCGTDCDDTRATVSPTAVEACNGVDDNCNGLVDEGVMRDSFVDNDHDGFGNDAMLCTPACVPPSGCVTLGGDCDDTTAAVHPGHAEVCDGLDNDCNLATPDPTVTCYRDADGDGYRSTMSMTMCSCPAGWLPPTAIVDCYDANAAAHPGVSSSSWFTTNRGDGSFDYDCSGVAEREINSAVVSGVCTSAVPEWQGSIPNCGDSGVLITACTCTSTGICGIMASMTTVARCH